VVPADENSLEPAVPHAASTDADENSLETGGASPAASGETPSKSVGSASAADETSVPTARAAGTPQRDAPSGRNKSRSTDQLYGAGESVAPRHPPKDAEHAPPVRGEVAKKTRAEDASSAGAAFPPGPREAGAPSRVSRRASSAGELPLAAALGVTKSGPTDDLETTGELEPIEGLDSDLESGLDLTRKERVLAELARRERILSSVGSRGRGSRAASTGPVPRGAGPALSRHRSTMRVRDDIFGGALRGRSTAVLVAAVVGIVVAAVVFWPSAEAPPLPQVAAHTSAQPIIDEPPPPPPAPTVAELAEQLSVARSEAAAGRIAAALTALKEPSHRRNPVALEFFAHSSYQLGDVDAALSAADVAVVLAPERWQAWFVKAVAHRDLGQPEKARVAFRKYLELNPKARNAASVRRLLSKL